MSTKEKFEITRDIIVAIMANTALKATERLELVPEAFEKIYNKIDELDKKSNDSKNKDFSNNYDEPNVI